MKFGIMQAILLVALVLVIFVVFLVVRTQRYPFARIEVEALASPGGPFLASNQAVERLSAGLRIPAVSSVDYEETNFAPFERFVAYLPGAYPEVFAKLEFEQVNNFGLVLRWAGSNPELEPILFLSHYDVVPAPAGESGWPHPPFSGALDDDMIYGRGTLDMKSMLFALLEAVDGLLAQGFQPEQDVWLAFGQDEEVGGWQGAGRIAAYFADKNIVFDAVFDEGGFVLTPGSVLSAVERPMAVIGVGEKGFLTLKITVSGQGGHSSTPPTKSSLVYAAEIVGLLNSNQLPARVTPPLEVFLDKIGGDMSFMARMAIANRWLMEPFLLRTLVSSSTSSALVRTTTAVTMMKGSEAPNVIATDAEIVVNFRILPGDTVEGIIEHVRRLCGNYDVNIEVLQTAREPSSISPTDSRAYSRLETLIGELFPGSLVTPYVTVGGTDGYKYQNVSRGVYRFMPVLLGREDQRSIHNAGERISVENYGRMIEFFKRMISTYQD